MSTSPLGDDELRSVTNGGRAAESTRKPGRDMTFEDDALTAATDPGRSSGQIMADGEHALSDLATTRSMVERAAKKPSRPDALLISVQDAAELLGIGRTRCFGLVSTGRISSVRIGGRRLVVRASLHDFVQELLSEEAMAENKLN